MSRPSSPRPYTLRSLADYILSPTLLAALAFPDPEDWDDPPATLKSVDLPNELLFDIFERIFATNDWTGSGYRTLCAASLVCKQWHSVVGVVLAIPSEVKTLERAVKKARKRKERIMLEVVSHRLYNLRTQTERPQDARRLPAELRDECIPIGDIPRTAGYTFDIWQGSWLGQQDVALMWFRGLGEGIPEPAQMTRYINQVEVWRNLSHPNVVPLYGWCRLKDKKMYLVSPWMKNDNIQSYCTRFSPSAHARVILVSLVAANAARCDNPDPRPTRPASRVVGVRIVRAAPPRSMRESFSDVSWESSWSCSGSNFTESWRHRHQFAPKANDRLQIREMLLGMQYLHSQGTIHGWIRPPTVLISDDGHAMISDIQQNKIVTLQDGESSRRPASLLRYLSPEHLNGDEPTIAGDVYSWATTGLSVAASKPPYNSSGSPSHAIKDIVLGHKSLEYGEYHCETFAACPEMWDLFADCWKRNAADRPGVDTVLQRLDVMIARRFPPVLASC